jgi:hypothetical protein
MNRTFKTISTATAAIMLGAAAHAGPALWTFDNVNFQYDGGTVSGSFTFDADTGSIGSFDISVAGHPAWLTGLGGPADATFESSAGATANYSAQYNALFFVLSPDRYLVVTPTSYLTDAGGTVALTIGENNLYGTSDVFNGFGISAVSGTISSEGAAAAPEPASWALMLGGFGLIGATMRSRKTAVSFG